MGVKKARRVQGPVPGLWTLGLEGRSAEDVLALLKEYRVERVVDVRGMPITDRAELSQGPLSRTLSENGLAYDLRRELAPSAAAEKAYRADGDRAAFAEAYGVAVPNYAVAALAKTAAGQRVCLLAEPRDPHRCHRGLLAERMEAFGFETRHIY